MSFIRHNSSVSGFSETLSNYNLKDFRKNNDDIPKDNEIEGVSLTEIQKKTLELFKSLPISKIRVIQSSMGSQKDAKQRELRELVGSKYRVLLSTAESVVSMNDIAQLQDQELVELVDLKGYNKSTVNVSASHSHLSKSLSSFELNYSAFLDTYILKDSDGFKEIKLKVIRHIIIYIQGFVNQLRCNNDIYENSKYEYLITISKDIGIFYAFLKSVASECHDGGLMEINDLKKLKNKVKKYIVKCLIIGNYKSNKDQKNKNSQRHVKHKLENLVCAMVYLNSSFSNDVKPYEISSAVEELLLVEEKWLSELFKSSTIKEHSFRKSMRHFKKFLNYTATIQRRQFSNSITKTILSIDNSSILYLSDLHHRYPMLASLEFDKFYSTFHFSSRINASSIDFSKKCQRLSNKYLKKSCDLVFSDLKKMVISMDAFMVTKYLRLMIINYAKYSEGFDDNTTKDEGILNLFLEKVISICTERIYELIDEEIKKLFELNRISAPEINKIESLWKLKSSNNILEYVYDVSKVSGVPSIIGSRILLLNDYFNRIRDIMNEVNSNFYKLTYNLNDLINNPEVSSTRHLEKDNNSNSLNSYSEVDDEEEGTDDELMDFEHSNTFVIHYSRIFKKIYVDTLRKVYFEKHIFDLFSKFIMSKDCDYTISELVLFKRNWIELQNRLSLTDSDSRISILNNKLFDKYNQIFTNIKTEDSIKLNIVQELVFKKYIPIEYKVNPSTLELEMSNESIKRNISGGDIYSFWEEDLPVMPSYELTMKLHYINEQLVRDNDVSIFSDKEFLRARDNFVKDIFLNSLDVALISVIENYEGIQETDITVLKERLVETYMDLLYLSKIINVEDKIEEIKAFETLKALCLKVNVEIKGIEKKVMIKRVDEYYSENRLIYIPLMA